MMKVKGALTEKCLDYPLFLNAKVKFKWSLFVKSVLRYQLLSEHVVFSILS